MFIAVIKHLGEMPTLIGLLTYSVFSIHIYYFASHPVASVPIYLFVLTYSGECLHLLFCLHIQCLASMLIGLFTHQVQLHIDWYLYI